MSRFPDVRAIIGAVTRGLGNRTSPSGAILPFGGVDNGDGTCSLMVTLGGGGGGGSSFVAEVSVVSNQYNIGALSIASQITPSSPVATQGLVVVENIGSGDLWVGPANVTALNGYPITSGNSAQFPLGYTVPLYAYSIAGTTVAVLVFS